MQLEENQTYSTKQMQEFFGVSESTWKKKKNELLANFGIYYEYKLVIEGRNWNYYIYKKIGEYVPLPKKGEKRDQIYQQGIMEIISEDNVQTAANVARRLYLENYDISQLKHKEDTVYANTRANMRIMFGTGIGGTGTEGAIMEKIWCRKEKEQNKYIPLTDKEIKAFFDLYTNEKESSKEYELELFNDYQNGLITKEEMYAAIGEQGLTCFISAKEAYKTKYGFYPIKVPVYEIGAFTNETKFTFEGENE
jgi:hypothetical protein